MFVIKYDKVSMIKLVQCIEKYPVIYDTKHHYPKEELDRAWDKIALEVGEKDSLCRERWHSIKSCYIRHLKYSALNSKRRPYYLAEFLDFMMPYVSERIKSFISLQAYRLDNLPSYLKEAIQPARQSYMVQDTEIKSEVVDVEECDESEWVNVDSDLQQPSSSQTLTKRSKPSVSFSPAKKHKTIQINDNNNEDVTFFKSLLPDIARMSCHQKLKFKQEALSIIEDILYANDDINIT